MPSTSYGLVSERLWEVLDVLQKDRRQARQMDAKGHYTQFRLEAPGDGPESLGTHQALINLTRQRQSQPA